jgi:hypothetical protein
MAEPVVGDNRIKAALWTAWRRSRRGAVRPGREVEALSSAEEARLARLLQSGDG